MLHSIIGLIVAILSRKLRVKLSGEIQLFNQTQGRFHTVEVTGGPGEETINISSGQL